MYDTSRMFNKHGSIHAAFKPELAIVARKKHAAHEDDVDEKGQTTAPRRLLSDIQIFFPFFILFHFHPSLAEVKKFQVSVRER